MAPAKAVGLVDGPRAAGPVYGAWPAAGAGTDAPTGGGDGHRDGKSSHCTACTLLAGPPSLVALVFAAIAFPAGFFRPFRSAARTLADHLSLGGIRSRAPPVAA